MIRAYYNIHTCIFTCGPFGSGKSHTLKYLDQIGVINLNQYVHIDPDKIKYDLPEAGEYIKAEPEMTGTLLHMESTYISLLMQYTGPCATMCGIPLI